VKGGEGVKLPYLHSNMRSVVVSSDRDGAQRKGRRTCKSPTKTGGRHPE
jgi:hypothetical protein